MGDPLAKVSSGSPFQPTASAWNEFIDAAKFAKMRGDARGLNLQSAGRENPSNTVLVKNNTGSELSPLAIVAPSSPIILPSENATEFTVRSGWNVAAPTSSDFGKFFILAESIPSGEVGLAWSGGIVPCKIQVDHASMPRADVDASSSLKLLANYHGSAQILWKESGTGSSLWAVVRMGQPVNVSVAGKANADVEPDSTGAMSVWASGSDTGHDIEGIHLDWMHGEQKISSGKEVISSYFPNENRWRFTHAECEE
jgi:hypothetical protein